MPQSLISSEVFYSPPEGDVTGFDLGGDGDKGDDGDLAQGSGASWQFSAEVDGWTLEGQKKTITENDHITFFFLLVSATMVKKDDLILAVLMDDLTLAVYLEDA